MNPGQGKHRDLSSGDMAWRQGMSISEIATVKGCSKYTVRRVLRSALQKLRSEESLVRIVRIMERLERMAPETWHGDDE